MALSGLKGKISYPEFLHVALELNIVEEGKQQEFEYWITLLERKQQRREFMIS